MRLENNQEAFFELLRAGLWEKEARLSQYKSIDYAAIMQLAEEQSVVGLVTAGLELVVDGGGLIPLEEKLQFVGLALLQEQRNLAMNNFIVVMMNRMKKAGISSVLIKGQGVAQCYAKPLWRNSGDVDLLLDDENYEKGKAFLKGVSEIEPEEYSFNKEYCIVVDGWSLELHGSLRSGLSSSFNKGVDAIQREVCDNHHVRYWVYDGLKIPLPEENEDVLVIFTHFIKHFYKGGLGIRQICDWCRLLWTFKATIDVDLLTERLKELRLVSEWKAFAAFAVEFLGMPVEAMPIYNGLSDQEVKKLKKKAEKIQDFILKSGNFGHNQDGSYFVKYPFLVRKTISMGKRIGALMWHSSIFPLQTMRYLPHVLMTGLKSAVKGE